MTYSARLIRASNPEWDWWLAFTSHDFYHTAAYHQFSEMAGEGEAFLAVYGSPEGGLLWPYLLREISGCNGVEAAGLSDVGSVYGYPGPLFWGCPPGDSFFDRTFAAIADLWRSQRAVCAFTRFHPLLENHRRVAESSSNAVLCGTTSSLDRPQWTLVDGGRTVSIDLTLGAAENRRHYQKILRQEIDAARRAGLRTEEDPEWQYLDQFMELYRDTMARNRAAGRYFFGNDYVGRLRIALGAAIHLLVTLADDQVAAAGVLVECNGIAQLHLAGSNPQFHALSPTKLWIDDARAWAQHRGHRVLHLGGGRAAKEDSLFAFKSRFSPRRHSFFTGRMTLDAAAYDALCEQRRVYAAREGLPLHESAFFPSYRAPLGERSEVDGGKFTTR